MSKVSYAAMTGNHGLLANREEFQGNSLSAFTFAGISPKGAGRLDSQESRLYYAFCDWVERLHLVGYVVMSYQTPIAWGAVDGEVYVTPQKFSTTTSKGQTYVRAWVNAKVSNVSRICPPTAEYLAEKQRVFGQAV